MLVELTVLLVSGYDLIWVWLSCLTLPLLVLERTNVLENSCFRVGHLYELFLCASLCQQKTHGIISKKKMLEME